MVMKRQSTFTVLSACLLWTTDHGESSIYIPLGLLPTRSVTTWTHFCRAEFILRKVLPLYHTFMSIVTDHIRSRRDGNVFTCLSTEGRGRVGITNWVTPPHPHPPQMGGGVGWGTLTGSPSPLSPTSAMYRSGEGEVEGVGWYPDQVFLPPVHPSSSPGYVWFGGPWSILPRDVNGRLSCFTS